MSGDRLRNKPRLLELGNEYAPVFDLLQTQEASGIVLRHRVDPGLAETLLLQDSQGHSKAPGVGHPAGLAEIGAKDELRLLF